MPKDTKPDLIVSNDWIMGVQASETSFVAENAGGNAFLMRYSAAKPTTEYGHRFEPEGPRDERAWTDAANDGNVWFKGHGDRETVVVISVL